MRVDVVRYFHYSDIAVSWFGLAYAGGVVGRSYANHGARGIGPFCVTPPLWKLIRYDGTLIREAYIRLLI